ncbi:MAG: type III pantothenate kinase [Melioribacteraceae bacterium]|nr:MAG: type III pantothenate kinase [Melioribacteraceae bacterium]
MFLAIDVGNTVTKAALFDKYEISETIRFPGNEIPDTLLTNKITECAISGVVPEVSNSLIEKIKSEVGITPFLISRASKLNIELDYDTPETLGIDRICGACGAVALFDKVYSGTSSRPKVIVTIDFGTATTLNVIKSPNIFAGGMIAPGLNTMFNSLTEKTAALPTVQLEDYDDIIGKSTVKSIASGVLNSTLGMIDKIITNLESENRDCNIYTFITGGNAEAIRRFISMNYYHAPDLVMRGIKTIYELNHA